MRLLIDIMHPAHVHFFKNTIWELRKKGHEILLTASKKDVNLDLLNAYGFPYRKLVAGRSSFLRNLAISPLRLAQLYWVAREFNPHLLCGIGNPFFTLVGRMLRRDSIVFDDTEVNPIVNIPTFFLANAICTPSCFRQDLGRKHIRYEGYHELAYLHPNYFKPDPSVLDELGIKEKDRYVILRFVAWRAPHDIKQYGYSLLDKQKLVEELEKHARVLISSESTLPEEFRKYRIITPPEKLHDLLYYATLFVCDSQTMTTEAGILGTHAIRCNTFVGPDDMGNFIELEKEYGLIHSFRESDKAIEKAMKLIQQADLKEEAIKKRQKLLADKIDVTGFMIDFIENYPESFHRYKGENKSPS